MMAKAVAEQNGIRAWQQLHKHYHRKGFAKAVRDHWEILFPRLVKLSSEVMAAVMEWEDKSREGRGVG